MLRSGESRRRLAQSLKAAYADGLLSEATFTARLETALRPGRVDPWRLVGDLSFRGRRSLADRLRTRVRSQVAREDDCPLLALDWTGATTEMTVGRHRACDVVLDADDVSRRHARIVFRDGGWTLQDLESTNGTYVNGVRVGRCRLSPGDRITLGAETLMVD